MPRSYSTIDVQRALQSMQAQIDQLQNDSRLDHNYKAQEIDRLRTEGNRAARVANDAQLQRIEAEQDEARRQVFAELQRAEAGVNWTRTLFLQNSFQMMAAGASAAELGDAIASAAEGRDLEALRAWASVMPAVRRHMRAEDATEFPVLAGTVRDALGQLEPAPVQAARAKVTELEQAAANYRHEVSMLSLKSAGLENPEFLAGDPATIFGGSKAAGNVVIKMKAAG